MQHARERVLTGSGLEGRRALVTGGSRGIGRAVAAALVRAGAHVVITARGAPELAAAARTTGANAVAADVTDERAVTDLLERCAGAAGGAPDILVNAAGAFAVEALHRTAVADFDRMLAVNLRAPFLLVRALLPALLERGRGHIVSIGSVAGRRAFARNGAYSASKFGLRGLHAVLDAELRGTGVRCTLIEPAATDTELWDAIDTAAHPGLPTRSAMMQPEDVADAVLFALTRRREIDIRNLLVERA